MMVCHNHDLLDRNGRNMLYLEMREKELSFTEVSKVINIAVSSLSRYFKHEINFKPENEKKLIDHVNSVPKYIYVKQEVR